MVSFLLRGFDDGGRGGSELFNLAAEIAGEAFVGAGGNEFGSDGGGAFSLEAFCFRDGRGLAALGFGDDDAGGSSVVSLKIAFLGCMKCFIAPAVVVFALRILERERERRERGGM